MKVKEIMAAPVITVPTGTSLPDVVRTLRDHRISGAPVVDGGGAVVGLISEYDLLGQRGTTAGEVMSTSVISVTEDTELDEVRHLLVERRIQRVPVLSGQRLVGIVSRSDVVALLATEWVCQVCGEAVRDWQPPTACPRCRTGANRFILQDPYPGD